MIYQQFHRTFSPGLSPPPSSRSPPAVSSWPGRSSTGSPEIFFVRNEDITCLQVFIHLFADLESWSELDAHGRHEVVSLEEHEGLPVDLLHHEVLHVVAAPRQLLDEVANLRDAPPGNVYLGEEYSEYEVEKVEKS